MPVDVKPLGRNGPLVSRIGLGAMGMTAFYNPDPAATEDESMRTFDRLVELSAPNKAFVDTAYIYAHKSGAHNEALVGRAIAKHGRDKFFLATKFGVRVPDFSVCSTPEAIRSMLAESLARLGTDHIDLYYQHRADPNTPIETTMGCLKELVQEGKIKYVGLSECTPDELRRAHAVHPVSAIQMEYSLQTRDIESTLLPVARELGVAIVCYSPLGRGFLSATITKPEDLPADDWRLSLPRFKEHFETNAAKAALLKDLAAAKGCTPAQLALAWLLSRGDDIFVIPGTKSATRLEENMGAVAALAKLSPADLAQIESSVPEATGDRYRGMWATFNTRLAPADAPASAAGL